MQVNEPQITMELAQELGLSERAFDLIKEQLGRTPTFTELNIYSVMWSERYSFKNAIHWLKTLPSDSSHLLTGKEFNKFPLIDIGHDLACALSMKSWTVSPTESNNDLISEGQNPHASLIANGIRPMASLHSLRLGSLEKTESQDIFKTIIKKISHYGNASGIPTISGELYFTPSYHQSPMLSFLSIGVTKIENSKPAIESWTDEPIFLIAPSEIADQNIPPLSEKRMLEACLEIIQQEVILDMQAIELGGLGSAATQLGWKTNKGIQIRLNPLKEWSHSFSDKLRGWLLIGKKGQETQLKEIIQKWDLYSEEIGVLTDNDQIEIFNGDQIIANLNPAFLLEKVGPPVKQKDYEKPKYIQSVKKFNPNRISKPKDYLDVAKKIWQSPNIISRKWLYEQYDSSLGTNTLSEPNSNATVLRIKNTKKALVLSVDCNPYYVHADPYVGAMIAVCEAARKVSCSGGKVKALSYCLNFGDPDKPTAYWQFVNAIKGMGDACRRFELAVTEGDVRFSQSSNPDTEEDSVLPTPIIGMMGIIDDVDNLMSPYFKEEGHQIYMLGTPHNDFASSEYLRLIHDVPVSPVPKFELDEEYHNQFNLQIIIKKKLIQSAHDISEGGLMASLLESAIPRSLGFDIETDNNFRKDAYLFGESQSRIIVTVSLDNEDELVNYLNSHNVSFSKLGEVSGHRIVVDNQDFGPVKDWKSLYENTLAEKLDN